MSALGALSRLPPDTARIPCKGPNQAVLRMLLPSMGCGLQQGVLGIGQGKCGTEGGRCTQAAIIGRGANRPHLLSGVQEYRCLKKYPQLVMRTHVRALAAVRRLGVG